MLLRRCSHGIKHQRPLPELFAALAQLPPFLVPSFAAAVEAEGISGSSTTVSAGAGASRGRSARSPRLPSPVSTWQLSSSSLQSPPLCPHSRSMSTRVLASSEGTRAGEAMEKTTEGAKESVGHEAQEDARAGELASLAEDGQQVTQKQKPRKKKRPPRPPSSPSESASSSTPNPAPRLPLPADAMPLDSPLYQSLETLKRHLLSLPPRISLPTLLHLRQLLKKGGFFASPKAITLLVSRFLSNFYDSAALRLINESVAHIRRCQRNGEAVVKHVDAEKLAAMYEAPLKQVMKRPAQHIPWAWVVDLTNGALHHGVVSPTILSSRMRALYEVKRYKDVEATWSLFAEHGFTPRGADYDEAILSRLLSMELKAAQELLAEKSERGLPTTVRTCLALLEGMEPYGGNAVMEEKMLSEADEEMLMKRRATRQDVRVLNRIMSVRAAREDLRDALDVVNYFDFSSFPPDLVARIRQLAVPASSTSSASPTSPATSTATTFSSIDRDLSSDPLPLPSISPSVFWRPAPDISTVVTLVGLSLRQQRADLALSLLCTAHDLRLGFNPHLALSIIRTLLSLHEVTAAEGFVFALPSGKATFAGMEYPALQPSTFIYEELFGGVLRYRGLGGLLDSLEYLREEKKVSIRVTEGITAALVKHLALEAEQKASTATDMLVTVQQLTAGGTRPTASHLTTLLRAAWQRERTRTGRPLPIEEEFPIPNDADLPQEKRTKSASLPPPTPRPSPPVHLPLEAELLAPRPGRQRTPSSLTRVRDSLIDRSITPTRDTTRHLLRNDHLLRFIPAKWAYLQAQVIDLGVRPTIHHLTSLMRAYLLLGDAQGARQALSYALDELHLPPHVALYSTLIAGLSRLGDHNGASSVYRDLTSRNIEPDRTLFAALAMSCARRRDLPGLERVLDEVRKQARQRDPPHPQLVALAQAQGQALRARSGGVPATVLAAYDPLLDPVFVTILYRSLVSLDRLEEAQVRVKDSLDKGLVPDPVLLMALRRSEHWLRRKRNNATGKTGAADVPSIASSSPSSSTDSTSADTPGHLQTEVGLGSAKVGSSGHRLSLTQIDNLLSLVASNIRRVQAATRGAKHEMSWKSMQRLQEYWAEAEKEEKEKRKAWSEEEDEAEVREGLKELDESLRKIEEESQSYSISI